MPARLPKLLPAQNHKVSIFVVEIVRFNKFKDYIYKLDPVFVLSLGIGNIICKKLMNEAAFFAGKSTE